MAMPGDALEFELLVDHPDWVPTIIDWWWLTWSDRMGPDRESSVEQMRQGLARDEYPVHIVAVRDGTPVGSAALKLQELKDLYPHNQYWLGSVCVDPAHRGAGIATALSQQVISMAQARAFPHLYLQTRNLSGGLYAKLGFEPLEQFTYRDELTLLMKKPLGTAGHPA